MKKTIIALAVVLTLILGVFAFSVFGEESDGSTVVFAPYTDADGLRQYCACGNKFVADENGTIRYVNGENGCKNHKDENGSVVAGCDGTLLTWTPWTATNVLPKASTESGNYYLTAPVILEAQNSIAANVKIALDLNGFEVKNKENTRMYSMHNEGVEMILTDTSANQTGKLTARGTHSDHSLTLWVRYGTLNMYGGTVDASLMSTTGTASSYAPCMRVNNTATFNMFGGKVIGGTCTDKTYGKGASVYISSGGTMNLYGGEVTGGNAYNGGNILVDGTLNAYGGKITDGEATNYGGNIYFEYGVVNISGTAQISGGSATYGGGISLASSSNGTRDLTVSGGTITNNESTSSGGGIYILGQSTKLSSVTISGGTISENKAGANGGGMSLGTRYANTTITGGRFVNNEAKSKGGSLYYNHLGTHSITGGTISGGSAANGGNVYLETAIDGGVSITGGQFENGTATNTGGNIYVAGKGAISGATITGGSAGSGGNIMVVGTLDLSDVNVSCGEATNGGGGNIMVDVIEEDSTLTATGTVTIKSGTYSYGHSSAQGGNIRLDAKAVLDIQGGRFEYGGIDPATGEVVTTQGGNLVILSENCSITGGTFIGGKAKDYAGNIRAGKDLTLGSRVVIQDGEAAKGGNLSNNSGGTLTIDGATISGGKAIEKDGVSNSGGGGNIYVESGKELVIKSGTIFDGVADTYGGNIYVNSGDLTLSGGTISGGQGLNGGSVALRGGTHTFTGGTITGGNSASAGGNVFVGNSAAVTIENVTITKGVAAGMGGGLYMGSGTVTINNCLLQGNEGNNGGNVAVYAGTLNFNGGKLENGIANNWGGNLWTDHGTLNIAGGEITGGTAETYGGGIALANSKNGNRVLNITGGLISGNTATHGGGLYIHGYSGYTTTVTISGGEISGNTANGNGGGMTMGTSFCSLTITGNAVIKDNTATKLGGNININYEGEKVISGGTITGGTAASGSCINVEGKSVTISGTPAIDAIRVNNAADGRLEVSDAAWTTAIAVEVTGQGAFANAASDKTACFIPTDALYQISYDATAQELLINLPVLEHVYVSDNGNDYGAGTAEDPYKTLDRALSVVSQNGTVHIVDKLTVGEWNAHGKTLTITGGELVLPETRFNLHDNVTFTDLTITMTMCTTNTSSNYGSYFFYCNGFKTVIEEDVVVQNSFNGEISTNPYRSLTYLKNGVETAVTATSTIYGGGPSATGVLSGTDLTILGGLWGNVYGGSNGVDIEGDVHLTVGGKINEGVDYVSHTISSRHVILGGSRAADISGTVYMNVTGGMYHTSTHGGTNGGGSIGAIEMRVTGGRGMALYGGGRSSGVLTVLNGVNFYLEGGEWEQVFGGTLSNCLTGDVNLYVTGGKITRRLYGGCYSNCDESSGDWTADNYVTGDVNLYIGSGAEITCDLKDPDAGWESIITGGKYADRGIYGHSRRAAPGASDAENARIIFLDQAAYDKHKGNLKAQDTIMSGIMRGVTAADYICYLGTNASGNVITVGATEVEDNVSNALDLPAATATITVPEGSYTYEGTALTPATVSYSDNWTYGDLEITYTNNDKAGTATASITYEGVTATTGFTVVEACKHTNTTTAYAQVAGTETHIVTVTCECGEQISQTTENCADEDKNYVCDLCEGALTKPVAQVGENQYASLAEAIASANGNAVLLLADCGDVTVTSDVTIDLAGFDLTGVTVAEGATLTLLDSATNDCEGAYGTASVTGAVAGGENYLVVSEDGVYSAHYYELKLTHVSLDPANDALGYKAQLLGDEIVQAHVKSFGFNLGVAGGLQKTYTKDATDFDGIFTLRLKGIMAANGGEMAITGSAFVIFDVEDQTVTTDAHTTTMKDTLETVNTNFESYTADQQAAVKAMVIKYASKMEGWNIDKIKA